MYSQITTLIQDNIFAVIAGFLAIDILLLILLIVLFVKSSKMKKRYKEFMKGKDGETLEDSIIHGFEEIQNLKNFSNSNRNEIERINRILKNTYQKVGFVRYDAFKDIGGKLSFALCMLDETNKGFVMNVIHGSEGCFTYMKELVNGECNTVLTKEERLVIDRSINFDPETDTSQGRS